MAHPNSCPDLPAMIGKWIALEVQSLRHDKLATQMQWQNSRHNDLVTQMQSMTSMMGRFVNSAIAASHPQNLPRQETAQQPRQ